MAIRAVLSFAGMQVGWFACVLGAARGYSWFGPILVAVGLAIHVADQPRVGRAKEAMILLLAALLGFIVDTSFLGAGVITVTGASISPQWLVALWPNLAAATARAGSLGSLSRRPILGAVLGALAAPLAYDGGARLGAIGIEHNRLRAFVAIGFAWSLVLPTLFWLRRWIHGPRTDREAVELKLKPSDPTKTAARAK